jgi:hypothetical protein
MEVTRPCTIERFLHSTFSIGVTSSAWWVTGAKTCGAVCVGFTFSFSTKAGLNEQDLKRFQDV